MKVPKKGKDIKTKVSKKGAVTKITPRKISKEKVLVVAQEIKYARLLSGNDKKTRDRVLKGLKKWLINCFEKGYEFKEEDFTRVWKGLFYAVWMSDKPLVQEELCDSVAGILDLFPAEQFKHAMLMTRAGFRTLATEWYGIDQHRMDKFLMLVRRYLRGSLRCVARCGWSAPSCDAYADMLAGTDGLFAIKTPHYARNASSMLLHITDCFLEELAKVSDGSITDESVSAILRPFVTYTCLGEAPAVCAAARRLLTALLRQSELGLEYADRTRAWQQMGCPKGGPEALELVSDDEETLQGLETGDAGSDDETYDEGGRALDPRAGRVHVTLAALRVPAAALARALRGHLAHATPKAHKRINICLQRFETLAAGEYPLRVATPAASPASPAPARAPKRSVRALRALDAKLKSDTDELKLRGLSRKHRKRLLKKTRLGLSIVDDVITIKSLKKKSKHSEWLIESTGPDNSGKDSSNQENQNKKKNKKSKEKNLKRKLEETRNGDEKKNSDVVSKKLKTEDKKSKKMKVKDSPIKKKEDVTAENKIKEKYTHIQNNKETQKSPKTTKTNKEKLDLKKDKKESPTLLINKLKNFSKQLQKDKSQEVKYNTKKKVKFELKNNSMQKPVDYYKSVRQSPSIPFDSSKKPNKTNLKHTTPTPINPFFKKKLRMKQFI